MRNIFKGTGIALITPFDKSGGVDHESLRNLVNHCIGGGVDFLVILGTTAETATLSEKEKVLVIETVIDANKGALPLLLGIGDNDTQRVCAKIKKLNLTIDGLLCVSPYYNKPSQEGIYQHFKIISENSKLPIVLYNVPGRTSSNMDASTTLRLAKDFDNIVAIKEASGDLEQVMEVIDKAPEGFDLLSGDDNLTLSIMALGGKGVVSVNGQAFPSELSSMIDFCISGNIQDARAIHYSLFKITKMLFQEGNPSGVKALLEYMKISSSNVRLPLWPVTNELKESICYEAARMGFKIHI